MAYLPFKQKAGAPQLGDPGMTSYGIPGRETNVSVTQTPGQAGTGFINLQDYFGLNKQAGQGMAQRLQGDQSAKETAARSQADSFFSRFGSAVDNGIKNPTISLGPDVQPNGKNLETYVKTYSGPGSPQEFDSAGYNKAYQDAYSADQGRQLMGSGGGVSELLGRTYGTGANPYSGGQRNLDSFLASQYLPAQTQTDPLASLNDGLLKYFGDKSQHAADLAAGAQGKIQQPMPSPEFSTGDMANGAGTVYGGKIGVAGNATPTKDPKQFKNYRVLF